MRKVAAFGDHGGFHAAPRRGRMPGCAFMAFTAPVVMATAASESTYQCV
jgi:hypothetical protein